VEGKMHRKGTAYALSEGNSRRRPPERTKKN
jgi:hypothetical protein